MDGQVDNKGENFDDDEKSFYADSEKAKKLQPTLWSIIITFQYFYFKILKFYQFYFNKFNIFYYKLNFYYYKYIIIKLIKI